MLFKNRENKIFRGLTWISMIAFIFCCFSPSLLMAKTTVTLQAGTIVNLRTDTPLRPATLNTGDRVILTVVSDVVVDGKVVIAAGAKARGEITDSKDRGMIGIPAKLALSIRSVEAVDGSTIALFGARVAEGKSKMAASIGLALICCILFALMKGGAAEIPAGTQIQTEVSGTVQISVE